MVVEVVIVPHRDDNYGFLIAAPGGSTCLAIDAGDDQSYFEAACYRNWKIETVLVTHHHGDHISHLESLSKSASGVVGPDDISGVTQPASDGNSLGLRDLEVQVLATPGHTLDMLNFYVTAAKAVFTGDTLFTLGCGRLFEGTPEMMFESLKKLKALPDDTLVYGAHEYTLANLKFALWAFPENEALGNRAEIIRQLRAEGKPTVPSTIGLEKATNPFLIAETAEEFARLRKAKDDF